VSIHGERITAGEIKQPDAAADDPRRAKAVFSRALHLETEEPEWFFGHHPTGRDG
jgi:hypothetical protein